MTNIQRNNVSEIETTYGVKQWAEDDGTPILEAARREGVRVEVEEPPVGQASLPADKSHHAKENGYSNKIN